MSAFLYLEIQIINEMPLSENTANSQKLCILELLKNLFAANSSNLFYSRQKADQDDSSAFWAAKRIFRKSKKQW